MTRLTKLTPAMQDATVAAWVVTRGEAFALAFLNALIESGGALVSPAHAALIIPLDDATTEPKEGD